MNMSTKNWARVSPFRESKRLGGDCCNC